MDSEEFRIWGKRMVDLVADYWSTIRDRKPMPKLTPGYMKALLPSEAPNCSEDWEDIFKDIGPIVLDGITHWQHPKFFAYYPTALSYPSVIGEILTAGIASLCFSWNSSPAGTELELNVVDWMAKMISLPKFFLNNNPGPGAGMIQSTASDCTFVALKVAWKHALAKKEVTSREKLVAYCSDQAHSSVEKAALLEDILIRKLPTNDKYSLQGAALEEAIKEDIKNQLSPFFVCATLGTTSSCAFDNLPEIGVIAKKYGLYLHVDAAYAGGAFICSEYQHYLKGVEFADSMNLNANKLLQVNFDCSLMWFKDAKEVEKSFLVDPTYLKHDYQSQVMDLRNLQIPLARRFRALKLWFVIRHYGVKGLRKHIRSQCKLAAEFGRLVAQDVRFELAAPISLGLVCFRLKGNDGKTERLLNGIHEDGRIYLIPTRLKNRLVLRLVVCSSLTNSTDIADSWKIIQQIADSVETN